MSALPNTAHDWATWLESTLVDIEPMGQGLYRGKLIDSYDFDEIVSSIKFCAANLLGMTSAGARTIEFNPASGHVYPSIQELIAVPNNRQSVPSQFTIKDLGYTAPFSPAPPDVESYLASVELWGLMHRLADHVSDVPPILHFIKSHDSRIEITPQFALEDAKTVVDIDEFDRDFVRTELHKDQKRNIIRSALIDLFKGKRQIRLGDLLRKYSTFLDSVKSSYAMYAADFSYEKVRGEVEKQNLEDTLRLNKTLADIQNQLLALPAALILAGAGIQEGTLMKNGAIFLGVCVFTWLMLKLIGNQRHSIEAIQQEVEVRKARLTEQPPEVSSKFSNAFVAIDARVAKQLKVLTGVRFAVICVLAAVCTMTVIAQWPKDAEPPAGSTPHKEKADAAGSVRPKP